MDTAEEEGVNGDKTAANQPADCGAFMAAGKNPAASNLKVKPTQSS